MQEIANLQAAPGVFHRLLSYIMSAIYPRRLKHLKMHHADPGDLLMEVPIEGSSILAKELKLSPSWTNWDSEIVIEFNHNDEKSENWINETYLQKKHDENFQNGVKRVNGKRVEEKGDRFEVKPHETGIQSDHKVSRKKVSFQDVVGEKKSKGKEKKSDRTDQMTSFNQAEKTKMAMRPPRAIACVISNINEKSEEFIRSRKAAMRRNFNLEVEKQ